MYGWCHRCREKNKGEYDNLAGWGNISRQISTHYLHAIYSLSTHYPHTICTISTQYLPSLSAHCLHATYKLSTQYLHIIYTISTQYLHIIYTLSTHYLRNIYRLHNTAGGPLFIASGGGYVQVGVVSYGYGCATQYPGVYTRVARYLYL